MGYGKTLDSMKDNNINRTIDKLKGEDHDL